LEKSRQEPQCSPRPKAYHNHYALHLRATTVLSVSQQNVTNPWQGQCNLSTSLLLSKIFCQCKLYKSMFTLQFKDYFLRLSVVLRLQSKFNWLWLLWVMTFCFQSNYNVVFLRVFRGHREKYFHPNRHS